MESINPQTTKTVIEEKIVTLDTMKILLIILALALFSCKKENCNCFEVTYKYETVSYLQARNVCTKEAHDYYVPLVLMYDYEVGQTYCDDKNFYL